MKIQLLDEKGGLNGWVVSLVFTTITIILLILGFIFPKVADAWVKMGENYKDIYVWSIGIWFGYKGIKAWAGRGINVTQ